MKYKDYLIIPILAMYIIMTSFAYVNSGDSILKDIKEPVASVDPQDIDLGSDVWYADGSRGSDSFYAGSVRSFSIDDMHLLCSTEEGKSYDLIFVNTMTAYDCNSDTYYQRADYDTLSGQISSGRFINKSNYEDYYVFKSSGKSVEFYADRVFVGKWELKTADTVSVYDNYCKGYMDFEIIYDVYGNITGISNSEYVYNLVT